MKELSILEELRAFWKSYDISSVWLILEDEIESKIVENIKMQIFAYTWWDWVCFAFLDAWKNLLEESPVVMCVPMASENSRLHIVWENLYDFLCLWSYFWYFSLEQLWYNFEETVQEIENKKQHDHEVVVINCLRKNLWLIPRIKVKERIVYLKDKYLDK